MKNTYTDNSLEGFNALVSLQAAKQEKEDQEKEEKKRKAGQHVESYTIEDSSDTPYIFRPGPDHSLCKTYNYSLFPGGPEDEKVDGWVS